MSNNSPNFVAYQLFKPNYLIVSWHGSTVDVVRNIIPSDNIAIILQEFKHTRTCSNITRLDEPFEVFLMTFELAVTPKLDSYVNFFSFSLIFKLFF